MKFSPRILLTLIALLSVASGCSEPLEPIPAFPNSAPNAGAGRDKWVPLPANFTVLSGSVYDDGVSYAESYAWKKVSGPASYSIESPGSKETKVANLEPGTYEFEFTATAQDGLTDTDTVAVSVYDPRTPGENELIFKNLEWQGNMEYCCLLVIENFNLYVPDGTAIRVFVERTDLSRWIEVKQGEGYAYGVRDNRFGLSANSDNLGSDIKITF